MKKFFLISFFIIRLFVVGSISTLFVISERTQNYIMEYLNVKTFLNKKVKKFLAMTGEVTLRGDVLAVGGIKEKILAAKRAGIKHILLPEANKKDVDDIKIDYLKGLDFKYVKKMEDVIHFSLN